MATHNIESFLDAMISVNALSKETYDLWFERFTTVVDPNVAPWDPWLDSDWRKKPRKVFADFADYYNDDAWIVQQARMLPSWDALEESPLKSYITTDTRVLDFGCGPGHSGIPAAQCGAHVTFADISPRLLQGVKALCNAHGIDVATVQVTEEIQKMDGEFDIIICKDVLEHVKYPIQVLEQLSKVLKKGGVMWMTVFFNGHELSPYHLPEHYHFDHGTEWLEVAARLGLKPIPGTDRLYRKTR